MSDRPKTIAESQSKEHIGLRNDSLGNKQEALKAFQDTTDSNGGKYQHVIHGANAHADLETNVSVTTNKIEFGIHDHHFEEHGACNTFIGIVRKYNCGREVLAIEYDSFLPLAEKTFLQISEEAQKLFGRAKIKITHRIGRLIVGEISIAIVVSTPHRDESFQICRYVIEQIKIRAPIWKKEYYTDGETEWLQGHILCQKSHGHSDTRRGTNHLHEDRDGK